MNAAPLTQDLALAFRRPFRRDGWKALLLSLLFLLIPCTGFISRGAAYAVAAGRRDGVGGWAKLGLKILAAQVLLAAPAIFFFAVYKTFQALFETMPFWFHLLMTLALLWSGVRTAVLSPVSAGVLALGAPLRTAVSTRELKSIVSLSMGRYLISGAISLAMLFIVGTVGRGLHLIPAYLVGAVLMALWNFFSAGLFMGCCRFALGIAPPRDPGAYPPPRYGRVVAGVLVCALLLSLTPAPAFAVPKVYDGDRPIPVNPAEAVGAGNTVGNSLQNYAEAYRYFSDRGWLKPGDDIEYDRDTKTYRVVSAETLREIRAPGEAIILTADIVIDFIPVLGNVKNGLQANYYYHQALATDDPELKKQYSAIAGYKVAGLMLGGVSKGLKAGSAGLKALGQSEKFAKYAEYTEKGIKILKSGEQSVEYVDKGTKVYDGTSNFLTYIDIFKGTDLSSKIGPHKIAEFIDDFEDILFKPRPEPQNVLIDFDPGGMPSGYTVPVSDGTTQLTPGGTDRPTLTLPTPMPTVEPVIGPIGAPPATPRPTDPPIPIPTLSLPDPFGRYSGTQQVPNSITSMGAVIHPAPNPVYVTVNSDGTATFQTEIGSSYSYSGFGATMNGSSSGTIRKENIEGQSTAGGVTYSFTQRVTINTTVSYAGEMYAGGGTSTEVAGQVDYTVYFTLSLSGDGAVITGAISSKPVAQGGEQPIVAADMQIGFTCTKMS